MIKYREEGPTMRGMLLAMMVLGSAQALTAQTVTLRVKPPFQPAETLSVTDITVPYLSTANGTVVLDALITETGKVQEVEVRRDIPSLTELAVRAVGDWKFSPATLAGKAIPSRMPVAVTFRPPGALGAPVPLPSFKPRSEAEIQAEFQPAEVTHAVFPKYPYNTVIAGSVVLEVTLSATGKAQETKVLRDLPPLTAEAKAVVGDWRFMPATFNGHPVRSRIVLAFVSRPLFLPAP
jgi:outer membrane biosynthesis protein TonB